MEQLVDLINQLFQWMKDGADRMLLGQVGDELVNDTITHFLATEEMMIRHKVPNFAGHKEIDE